MNEEKQLDPKKDLELEKKLIDQWLDGFIKEDPSIIGDYHYKDLLKIAFDEALKDVKLLHEAYKNKGE